MFVVTVLLLILFFPHGGKFRFEYQKGKPWMHQVLVAPFDFPIYKSEADLKANRDSILKNFAPYFNYNAKTGIEKKNQFRQMFPNYWNYYNRRYPNILNPEFKRNIEYKTTSILDIIYKKGIIELPEEYSTLSKQTASVTIVRDNIAEEASFDDVFTQKKAYEYFIHELEKYSDEIAFTAGFNPDAFFKGLKIEEYISPNLYYDEITSGNAKKEALDNLSLTEGMVLTGERIIFTGDIVSSHSYKVLESLKKEHEQRMGFSANYAFVIFGQAILVIICITLIYVFLSKFRKQVFKSIRSVGFIFFIVVLFSLAASLAINFKPYGLYMIPFAIIPILLKTFYDSKLALFIHTITILLIGFWAPNSFEFVFLSISAGIVAILSLSNMYRRNKMFFSSAWIILNYTTMYIGIALYQEGNLNNINTDNLLFFAGNGLLVLSSIPLIYIFEKLFGFLSDATLLEISDSNQPLLRRLAELAPGTFQHSLQVANLSEEAIFKIGGNPLLVRVGALYHDIGKMENPVYFIENLSEEMNPHEKLTYEESANIIISHVTKGIEIAHKYRLPEPIIDFIRTHHGTSTAHYFYRSFIKQNPDSDVNINKFSYPGPKPNSREMTVVMIADSVEAASRSLKQFTEKDLNQLVDSIIDNLLMDNQFNEAEISLKEIEIVRATFKKRLKNIYHVRIEYPKLL